jgi:TolA-binding protein
LFLIQPCRARRLPTLILGILATSWPAGGRGQGPVGREAGGVPAATARQVPEALNFANGLFRERRYEMAADEYERFLKAARPGPDADEARFGLANARLFQGRYDLAKKQFEIFLKGAPGHPNAATAWYRVGETAYMLGDLRAARQALEKFTAENPGHRHLETAWPYLGDVCLRLGDLPRARQAYDQALATHPEGRLSDRARFGLGRTLALEGDTEAALGAFRGLVERGGPEWTDRSWLQIGQILARSGQQARAVEAFETLERVAPRSLPAAESRLKGPLCRRERFGGAPGAVPGPGRRVAPGARSSAARPRVPLTDAARYPATWKWCLRQS